MDVEEGDNIELRCQARGVPEPNITWYWRALLVRDGKESKLNYLHIKAGFQIKAVVVIYLFLS